MTTTLFRGLVSDSNEDSIADTASRVRSLFSCCQNLRGDDIRQNVVIQSERYNLWTSNIGVFASRHASLDYRLRTAPSVRAAIDGNLEILCKQLLSVLKGSPNVSDELGAFSDLSQSAVSSFGLKLLQLSKPSPQDQTIALKSIEATITTLHQLSLAIRKASNRNSFMKTQRLFDEDVGYSLIRERVGGSPSLEEDIDTVRFETTKGFRQFVIKYLELRWLQKPIGEIVEPQLEAYRRQLLGRCAEAISFRRRQLIYFRTHQSKLSARPIAKLLIPKPETALPNPGLQAQASIPSPFATNNSTPFLEHGIPSITQSDTVPSEFQSTAFRLAPPMTAAPSSTVSSEGGALRSTELFEIPPPPELDLGEKEKLCPYCCLVLPSKTFYKRKKSKQWRYHILEDLQPYICLFKNCNMAGKTYGKFKDWQAHLGQPHYDHWVCPLHPEGQPQPEAFNSLEECEKHLKTIHPDINSATVSQIATSAGQLAPLLQQCFVCFAEIPDMNAFQRHLASHFESAFLMALPWRDDIKDVDFVPSDKVASLTNSNPHDDDGKQHPNVAGLFESAADDQAIWATGDNPLSKENFAARLAEMNAQADSEQDNEISLQKWASLQIPGIPVAPTFHVFTILSIVRFKRLLAHKRNLVSKAEFSSPLLTSYSMSRFRPKTRWRVAIMVISFPIRLQISARKMNSRSNLLKSFSQKIPKRYPAHSTFITLVWVFIFTIRLKRRNRRHLERRAISEQDLDISAFGAANIGSSYTTTSHARDPNKLYMRNPQEMRPLRHQMLKRAPPLVLFEAGNEAGLQNWNRAHKTNFSRD